jgi:hypothetical protein
MTDPGKPGDPFTRGSAALTLDRSLVRSIPGSCSTVEWVRRIVQGEAHDFGQPDVTTRTSGE